MSINNNIIIDKEVINKEVIDKDNQSMLYLGGFNLDENSCINEIELQAEKQFYQLLDTSKVLKTYWSFFDKNDNEFTVNVYNSNFILLDKFSFNKQYSKNLQGYYPVEEVSFDYNSITLNNDEFNALVTKHENFEGFITKTEVIKGQKLVKGNFGLYNSFKLHDKVIVKKEVNGEIKPIILEIIDLKSTECWLYTNESDFDLIKPMDKVYRFID